MVMDRVVGYWALRASIVMALMLLVAGGAQAALAGNQPTGGIVGVETPEASGGEPTPEPTPPEEESPGAVEPEASGDGPTPEPTPPEEESSGDVEGEGPGTVPPTATPGGNTGGDALAPGTVTVVLWTSDKGVLPERASVCIGGVCQSASRGRSGVDLWFDRVEMGWQQVVVDVGAPYGATTTEVEVRPGRNSLVELTLVVTQPIPGEKLDPTAVPVSAEGPLRNPVQLEPTTTSPAGSVSVPPSTNDLALASTNDLALPSESVSALPSTGTPQDRPSRALIPTIWAISGLLLVAGTMARGVNRK
jgi:hypothetical protein